MVGSIWQRKSIYLMVAGMQKREREKEKERETEREGVEISILPSRACPQ
jgi:hypothetical protein